MSLSKRLTGEATLIGLTRRNEIYNALCELGIELTILIKSKQMADYQSTVHSSHIDLTIVVQMECSLRSYHSFTGGESAFYFSALLASFHSQ